MPLTTNTKVIGEHQRAGFMVNRTPTAFTTQSVGFNTVTERPPMFDLAITGKGLPEMRFNGVNTITYKTVHNAAGTATVASGISWGAVGLGVVGVAVVVEATKSDSTEPAAESGPGGGLD